MIAEMQAKVPPGKTPASFSSIVSFIAKETLPADFTIENGIFVNIVHGANGTEYEYIAPGSVAYYHLD